MIEPCSSRRGFLGGVLAGACVYATGCASSDPAPAPASNPKAPPTSGVTMAPPSSPYLHPYDKLAKISSNKRQIWPVLYVGQKGGGANVAEILADVESSISGGADAVVLINEYKIEGVEKTQFSSKDDLDQALAEVRKKFPKLPVGVNWLGDDKDDPYGYKGSFALAKKHDLKIVWTDFSGVDLIKECPRADLHDIQEHRPPAVFYCSGIHMKYSHLLDPNKTIEESALQAMGWVDGIIVTGPKTGVASDPEIVKRARYVIGRYPLGVASGTTPENVGGLKEFIDFCLVHTGIQEKHRIVAAKVKALREAIG